MFQFEQFPVYIKAEEVYLIISNIIKTSKVDRSLKDQLRRASYSILLNIAEGAGKYSKNDKKNFYVIARGSVHECVSIIRILKLEKDINEKSYQKLHDDFVTISQMLSGLIKKMMELMP